MLTCRLARCILHHQEGPGLNTLVVVTDSPLIWRSASSAASASAAEHRHQETTSNTTERERSEPLARQASGGVGKASQRGCKRAKRRSPFSFYSPGRSRSAPPSWSAQPREAAALLSLLFSWAKSGGDDDVRGGHLTAHAKRGVPGAVVAQDAESAAVTSSKALDPKASSSHSSAQGRKFGRSFTIVCPATRVRMNIETYVKDSETGRVAVQWCLASKDGGE